MMVVVLGSSPMLSTAWLAPVVASVLSLLPSRAVLPAAVASAAASAAASAVAAVVIAAGFRVFICPDIEQKH